MTTTINTHTLDKLKDPADLFLIYQLTAGVISDIKLSELIGDDYYSVDQELIDQIYLNIGDAGTSLNDYESLLSEIESRMGGVHKVYEDEDNPFGFEYTT